MPHVLPERLIAKVQFLDAHLASARCDRVQFDPDKAGPVVFRVDHRSAPAGPPGEEQFSIYFDGRVRVEPKAPEAGSGPLVTVECRFELLYRVPRGTNPSAEELHSFAATNAIMNVWPYFREFVHSISVRMGLPPIVIPVFRLPRAPVATAPTEPGATAAAVIPASRKPPRGKKKTD